MPKASIFLRRPMIILIYWTRIIKISCVGQMSSNSGMSKSLLWQSVIVNCNLLLHIQCYCSVAKLIYLNSPFHTQIAFQCAVHRVKIKRPKIAWWIKFKITGLDSKTNCYKKAPLISENIQTNTWIKIKYRLYLLKMSVYHTD